MRLILDLRFAPGEQAAAPGDRVVTLAELARSARRPRQILRMLRGDAYQRVTVLVDPAPVIASGVQAGARVLAGLARARRFELDDGSAVRESGRAAFLAGAVAAGLRAVPAELWHTARLLRALARTSRAPKPAPGARASALRSVTYLRTEPTIAFQGRFVGGAAEHTTGVINGLVENGLDVHVYAAAEPPGIHAPATAVPVRRVHHLVHWLTVAAYGEEIVRAAEARAADFVYQRYALGSWAGLELAERLGVPLVLEFNGSEVWAERNWGKGELPLADRLVALEDANVRAAALVVVVSDVLKDQLVEAGMDAARVLVNPNGVDAARLAPLRERSPADWRKRLELPEAPTIGFVGTFGFWHGVTVLPAMVGALATEHPDARWVLIGDGHHHAEVCEDIERRGLAGRVLMTGVVPRERAVELLAASDVCVSPHVPNPDGSRFFGSPTKLFEYMGLAKPIVASDLEQIGEVIDHERNGLLCPPGDAEAAAAAVARLLGDEPLSARLGAAALQDAVSTYSWTAHVRRILDALER